MAGLPPEPAAGPVAVERVVSQRGQIQVGNQRLQVGLQTVPAAGPGPGAQEVRTLRRLLVALVAAALAVMVASPAKAITNGQPDGNRHPYVGLAVFEDAPGHPAWRCSASLLSPTVVLTAGHCTDETEVARVWFAEDVQNNSEYPFGGATSYEGVPYTYPGFCIGCGNGLPGFAYRDIGIIVLTEPVPTSVVSRYAQLPTPGPVDDLSSKAPVTLVGYGVQERIVGGGPPVWAGLRVRLMAPARLGLGLVHPQRGVRPGDREPRVGWRHLLRRLRRPDPERRHRHGAGGQLLCDRDLPGASPAV